MFIDNGNLFLDKCVQKKHICNGSNWKQKQKHHPISELINFHCCSVNRVLGKDKWKMIRFRICFSFQNLECCPDPKRYLLFNWKNGFRLAAIENDSHFEQQSQICILLYLILPIANYGNSQSCISAETMNAGVRCQVLA